ncbi:glutathione S-transferase family protein [Salarchaeum japonicum]|nr:glutathione S-transferase family protein [Salarchaeum japonicum]
MGRMVDGEWHTDEEMLEHDESGEFERAETSFRDWIRGSRKRPDEVVTDGPEPASGRYHLYVSYACPWAHRALTVRALLGLEDDISVSVVDPVRYDQGWEFDASKPGSTEDHLFGSDYLREVYREADSDYTGRVTVPVLWDTEEDTIVNNESEEIIRMFATAFSEYDNGVDLYPEGDRGEIDDVIDDVYPRINNGVYRAGFAESQDAYDDAVRDLFDALEEYDARLSEQRFLVGDSLTLADVCMFTTLYRFDEVYHNHFKCNYRQITDYDALWGYLRELCQLPGVEATCDMWHVKQHYYRSHGDINPKRRVPIGPDPDFFAPHARDDLPGDLPDVLAA